jgi:hypothetical protein
LYTVGITGVMPIRQKNKGIHRLQPVFFPVSVFPTYSYI